MNQLDENILLAGLAGHVKEVEKWHQMGGSLEVRNNSRDTLMHIAVSLNYTDLFDYVIDRVPRPFLDSLNREGLTPLMVACEKPGTEKMIEALLKRGVHRRKLTQDTKFTPLMTLAATGRIEAIDLFYRYPDERAYPELDLPKEKRKGIRLNDIRALYPIMDRNHLMAATLAHQIEAMKFILKQEPALLNTQDRCGLSSLLLAARDGKKDIEPELVLLDAGADPFIMPTTKDAKSFIEYVYAKCMRLEKGSIQFEKIKVRCEKYPSLKAEIQRLEAVPKMPAKPVTVKSSKGMNALDRAFKYRLISEIYERDYDKY